MDKVTIYTGTNKNDTKAIKYLRENNIPFEKLPLSEHKVPKELIKRVVSYSLDGVDEVVKLRGKVKNKEMLEKFNKLQLLNVHEQINYIYENQELLKSPLAFRGNKYYSGFNKEEYDLFFSRTERLRRRKMLYQGLGIAI